MDGDFKHLVRRIDTLEAVLHNVYDAVINRPPAANVVHTTGGLNSSHVLQVAAGHVTKQPPGFSSMDFPALKETGQVVSNNHSSLFRQAVYRAAASGPQHSQQIETRE